MGNGFHFTEDYRALVRDLMARYPLAEAMSRAVGGDFEALGRIEKQLLVGYGLEPQHTLVDVGCGSGRLAKQLVGYLASGRVLGTDVVPELLDYARSGCPNSWEFALVDDIRIPFGNDVADFASFFSVFTHLLHEESFSYLIEARRAVKPGGTIVFSFLEFADNWGVFKKALRDVHLGVRRAHLNMFIGRDALEAWARHLGMSIVDIRSGSDAFVELPEPVTHEDGRRSEGRVAFGQSVCVLRNDRAARSA
jgi:ubiquinone/menaquinone biosynthesis C-methylase UbiE